MLYITTSCLLKERRGSVVGVTSTWKRIDCAMMDVEWNGGAISARIKIRSLPARLFDNRKGNGNTRWLSSRN